MAEQRTPTLGDMLAAVMGRRLAEVRTAIPAIVTAYDAETQTCNAQPVAMEAFEDEAGDRQVEPMPVITGIPVCWQRGGVFYSGMPLAAGDPVLIVFSMRSIDRWKTRGGVVDPGDDRQFHISDAMAIPGGSSKPQAIPNMPTDGAIIGAVGGAEVVITATQVLLGARAGTVPIALAPNVEARLTALENHRHFCSTGTGSKPLTMSAAYTAQYPGDTGTASIPNPPHGDPFHVHGDPPDDPAPDFITDPLPSGGAVAATIARGI